MKNRYGFAGVWTVLIIFIIAVVAGIAISEGFYYLNDWYGVKHEPIIERDTSPKKPLLSPIYEDGVDRHIPMEEKDADFMLLDLEVKKKCLQAMLVVEKKIKSVCTCGFDFNPWKDNETHLFSHGLCAFCYQEMITVNGLTFKQHLYDHMLERMMKALMWSA